MSGSTRRAVMMLYAGEQDHISHRVRLVLAEKGLSYETEIVNLEYPPEDFLELSPYQILPTLTDRELTLFGSQVIMEYLDERFPHRPLMPVDPVSRARTRLMIGRIERDWNPLVENILTGDKKTADQSKKELRESITMLAPIFAQQPFFMSDEFSLVDCCISPILWRLKSLGVKLPDSAKEVEQYAERLFLRGTFQKSLTEEERELNG